jgi:hypothetical protein
VPGHRVVVLVTLDCVHNFAAQVGGVCAHTLLSKRTGNYGRVRGGAPSSPICITFPVVVY